MVDTVPGELEAFEPRQVLNEHRREKDARDDAEREKLAAIRTNRPRAVIGHDREGRPVYDDDLHVVTNWAD